METQPGMGLSPITPLKELGFGLAAAVFLAATVVQVLLVPATLRLLGKRSWWLPDPLARMLPKVQLDRDTSRVIPPVAVGSGPAPSTPDRNADRQVSLALPVQRETPQKQARR